MAQFTIKQSANLDLTSHSGLALLGQCFDVAQVNTVVDRCLPVSQGMRSSDLVKSAVALLSLGKSDFQAVEAFRDDRFFKQALDLHKVPSSVWLRQRLDAKARELRELAPELTLRLMTRGDVPITAHEGFVCLDIDTFVMNNDGSKKEFVGRTYQGVDGYCPIAAYLGNEGWCLGLELRPGTQHSACETHYFLERVFERARRVLSAEQVLLMRDDSGFDSVQLLMAKVLEGERWKAQGRRLAFITKWNPRRQDKQAWVARAEAAAAFVTAREGKRVALLDTKVDRAFGGHKRTMRLVVEVTERTIDKKGQRLLVPDIEIQGWWTSLDKAEAPDQKVIDLYKHHGMHEQFHSEFKTDLDLERLPSGKFDTNDCIVQLASFAYNCLRLLGQLGLTGELSPVRHPAKRRRLKTVLQEIMNRAAKVVKHAKQWVLDFGRGCVRHVQAFEQVSQQLWKATSS